MKMLLALLLLCSVTAHAKTLVCNGKTAADTKALLKSKISTNLLVDGVLYRKVEFCASQWHNEDALVCAVGKHTLVFQPKGSVLVTTQGKAINLVCTEEDIIEPAGGVGGSN